VTEEDRVRWNLRHAAAAALSIEAPAHLAHVEQLLPRTGDALDLACGRGAGSVWLAARGLTVTGLDVSPVAIESARSLASRYGLATRCRFDVVDLDDGLPEGPPVDLILSHLFHDPHLATAIVERLRPRGILAIATLSEVGASPGRFRATRGELLDSFAELDTLADDEHRGHASLVGRKRA
jgi:2-polyprenyl-3-methyl-5-hydroxy-6-metoxy-1,4-benzoquinol methylase